jgi:hypothetical protein
MTVIDRIQPQVLHVPAKGGKLHAHINPGNSDAADFLIILFGDLEDGGRRLVYIIEVPIIGSIVEVLVTKFRGLELGEARTKLMRG